jgi:hypothetical protein
MTRRETDMVCLAAAFPLALLLLVAAYVPFWQGWL